MTETLKAIVRRFLTRENGAVTVEWVVLTAAVVGIAFAATIPVFSSTESASFTVNQSLSSAISTAGGTN